MALKTAAQYSASYLARIGDAAAIGELMWARWYSESDPQVRYSDSNPDGMQPTNTPEAYARFGNQILPDILTILTAADIGQTIIEALTDAEILPSGSPAMAAGGDPVTGKGVIG
jgi:hypothetical protein